MSAIKRRLVVVTGARPGDAFVVRDGAVVGRSKQADWMLPGDTRISGKHFAIGVDPDGAVTIADLESSNGTVVDGEKLGAKVRRAVRPGSRIVVGDTELAFEELELDLQSAEETIAADRGELD